MTFRLVTMSHTGDVDVKDDQDQAQALEALRAFHGSKDTLLAGAMYQGRPGTWLFLLGNTHGLNIRVMNATEVAARKAESAAPPPPPKAKPGAAFHRRTAQIEASPGTFLAGKSADQVEEVLRVHGEHLRPHTLAFVRGLADGLHNTELYAAAEANALPETVEPARSGPGAKFLRNQEAAAERDEERRRVEQRKALAAEINADPVERLRGIRPAILADMAVNFHPYLTERSQGVISAMLDTAPNLAAESSKSTPATAGAKPPKKASTTEKSAVAAKGKA